MVHSPTHLLTGVLVYSLTHSILLTLAGRSQRRQLAGPNPDPEPNSDPDPTPNQAGRSVDSSLAEFDRVLALLN